MRFRPCLESITHTFYMPSVICTRDETPFGMSFVSVFRTGMRSYPEMRFHSWRHKFVYEVNGFWPQWRGILKQYNDITSCINMTSNYLHTSYVNNQWLLNLPCKLNEILTLDEFHLGMRRMYAHAKNFTILSPCCHHWRHILLDVDDWHTIECHANLRA